MGVRPIPSGPVRDRRGCSPPLTWHRMEQWARVPQPKGFKILQKSGGLRGNWLSQEGKLHSGPHSSTLCLTCRCSSWPRSPLYWEAQVPNSKPYFPSEETVRPSMISRPRACMSCPGDENTFFYHLSAPSNTQEQERLEFNYVPSPKGCCGLAIRVHFRLHLLYMTYMGVGQRGFIC